MKTNRNSIFRKGILLPCLLLVAFLSFTAFTFLHTDPVARLGTKSGGTITADDFKEHDQINAVIDGHDKIRECTITGFNMTRVGKREDPVEVINLDGKFNKKSVVLVELAKAGDIYYFDKVKAKCPGDAEERKLNSLVFKIK